MARKEVDSNAAALMEQETTAMAVRDEAPLQVGAVNLDDTGVSAIQLPRLQIAYGVGNLAKEGFNPGELVLGGEHLLAKKGDALTVIIIHLDQYWKEYLDNDMFQAGIMPRVFRTEAEVLANEGTTAWGADGSRPTFNRALDVRMLIEKPEGVVCGMFGVDLPDGKVYAPAIITLDKSGYRESGPGLITACKFALHGNTLKGRFSISTRTKAKGQNVVVVPSIKLLVDENSEETQDAIRSWFQQ